MPSNTPAARLRTFIFGGVITALGILTVLRHQPDRCARGWRFTRHDPYAPKFSTAGLGRNCLCLRHRPRDLRPKNLDDLASVESNAGRPDRIDRRRALTLPRAVAAERLRLAGTSRAEFTRGSLGQDRDQPTWVQNCWSVHTPIPGTLDASWNAPPQSGRLSRPPGHPTPRRPRAQILLWPLRFPL